MQPMTKAIRVDSFPIVPPPLDSDHYATLGLDRACTAAQIRSAFRVLAKRHHPDVNADAPNAVEQSQILNAAHEILSDPAKRRAYDRELRAAEQSPPQTRARLERNVRQEVRLRIEEFIRGTSLQVRVNDPANPDGTEIYELQIPPETAVGAKLRVPRSGTFDGGFVEVRLKVLPGFRFKARGADLRCDLRISAQRATQGGTETLSSPTGTPLRVTIPPRVARGEALRIPGQGMPKTRGGRGDLLVRITYRPEVRISRLSR